MTGVAQAVAKSECGATAVDQHFARAGFAKLTTESVADRAKTGVAVLYRRWPNRNDLVVAAIRHYGDTHPLTLPDTGNLRDDVRELLEELNDTRTELATAVGHERGEINLERIPPDGLDLPFPLVRHDILRTLRPIPPERIRSIVDDVFWPLVTRTCV